MITACLQLISQCCGLCW